MIKYYNINKITQSAFVDLCCIDNMLCINISHEVLNNLIQKFEIKRIRCKSFGNKFCIIDDNRISPFSLLEYIPFLIICWTRKECEEFCEYTKDNPNKYLCGCEKPNQIPAFVLHYNSNNRLQCLSCHKWKTINETI